MKHIHSYYSPNDLYNRIIDGLNESAEQVASASSQVSTASQSLAEGASEQAANNNTRAAVIRNGILTLKIERR